MQPQHESIFSKYSLPLEITCETIDSLPLLNSPHIPHIIDILSREKQHHALLYGLSSTKIQDAFLLSTMAHLRSGHTPKRIRDAHVIYFDVSRFQFGNESIEQIIENFQNVCEKMQTTSNELIFILNSHALFREDNKQPRLTILGQLLLSKLLDPQWHFLILTPDYPTHQFTLDRFFSTLRLTEPTEKETLGILKTYQDAIENFHHIFMADEVFPYALSLTSHYLGGKSRFDKSLELLDSGAARASTLEPSDPSSRPLLTAAILSHVVSEWTHIPLSHLHHNKFKLSQFMPAIQKKIMGQNAAIHAIGSLLQSTCLKFETKTGPIFNLLLAGPSGCGKKEFARVLTDYLFSTQDALLHINLNKHDLISSLSDVFVTVHTDKIHKIRLSDAIQAKPYAVVLFENFSDAPESVVHLFKDIFAHGYTTDCHGIHYDFRYAIVIMTTTLGADHIAKVTKQGTEARSTQAMNLMQLILNENSNQTDMHHQLSPQDIREHILPELKTFFSSEILRHSHIVPFTPIDQLSLEHMIKSKLNSLTQSLEDEFNIELSYAPEVVKFLAHETIKQNENSEPLIKLFEQHVHANIASEILSRIDDKHRPKRIALLLNESGKLLRCEFIVTHDEVL